MSFGVSFSRRTPIFMFERTGTDARSSYEVRQNVVIGLGNSLLWEQEVPGSNPGAPTDKLSPCNALRCRGFFRKMGRGEFGVSFSPRYPVLAWSLIFFEWDITSSSVSLSACQ